MLPWGVCFKHRAITGSFTFKAFDWMAGLLIAVNTETLVVYKKNLVDFHHAVAVEYLDPVSKTTYRFSCENQGLSVYCNKKTCHPTKGFGSE